MLRAASQLRLGLPAEAGPEQIWGSLPEADRRAILGRLAVLLSRAATASDKAAS
jgi:hypothetical protein